eukprot:CAMPEP_0195029898 /NCGR_PEP_ID=MMETSP0326_2-20130528/57711_1 /TAXON_ID=2866 ORGANISM="Crypthecodinium cohnii, Strain Seligo" /NCGR_SAMPLE_ID=MMETSP0326_2 /ASSEMBLY_ACC=CAM_ASM_000348 /LENGTH=103 /DNA_ID=CAMNT_0040052985 /DNA_START=188 /DNA_END=496 /DNA_ORIENTATION=-
MKSLCGHSQPFFHLQSHGIIEECTVVTSRRALWLDKIDVVVDAKDIVADIDGDGPKPGKCEVAHSHFHDILRIHQDGVGHLHARRAAILIGGEEAFPSAAIAL